MMDRQHATLAYADRRWNVSPRCLVLGLILAYACQVNAAEMVWRYELQRVQEAISDGEYEEALEIARIFDKEFGRAKRSHKAKYNWQDLEWATVSSHLAIGLAERMVGDYAAAGNRFEYALNELKQVKLRNTRTYASMMQAAQALQVQSVFDAAWAIKNDDFYAWFLAQVKKDRAGQAAQAAGSAAAIVMTTNSLLMLNYDVLGTLAIDKSLPLTATSLKQLREAQKYLGLSQEVREDRRFGYDPSYSIYGDERISFLINYGTLYLRRAELKRRFPDLPPADESVELLIERASDYFAEAEERLSVVKETTSHYAKIIHEGPLEHFKSRVVNALLEEESSRPLDEHKARVDGLCLGLQQLLLGHADLDFKQSELAILKMRVAFEAGRLNTKTLLEGFDDSEQRLLDAADKLKLITDNEDHPFLVICYAELVGLEAIRANMQQRKPDDSYLEYLALAEDLMAKRKLSPDTVQAHYLTAAKELWQVAEGGNN